MAARPHGPSRAGVLIAGLVAIFAVAAMLVFPNRANGPEAPQAASLAIGLPKAPPLPDGLKMPAPPIPVPK